MTTKKTKRDKNESTKTTISISKTSERQFNISVHSIAGARDCPTRMVLHLQGYRDAATDDVQYRSMDAGTAGHKAMAAWLKGEDWMEALEDWKAFTAEHGMIDDRRGYPNMVKIVQAVVDNHPLDMLPFIVDKPEYVETSFCVPLGETEVGGILYPVNLIGYMDAAPLDRRTHKRWVLEHKFTGRLDQEFIKRFIQYDPQVTAYILGAQLTLGEEIQNCWVNAVQMAMVPSSDRKCNEHGVPYRECGIRHAKQTFVPVERSKAALEEFRKNALFNAKDAIKAALFAEKYGEDAARKTPRLGILNNTCEFCDMRRWCIVANRRKADMKTMLVIPTVEVDDVRLRTGFIK